MRCNSDRWSARFAACESPTQSEIRFRNFHNGERIRDIDKLSGHRRSTYLMLMQADAPRFLLERVEASLEAATFFGVLKN